MFLIMIIILELGVAFYKYVQFVLIALYERNFIALFFLYILACICLDYAIKPIIKFIKEELMNIYLEDDRERKCKNGDQCIEN